MLSTLVTISKLQEQKAYIQRLLWQVRFQPRTHGRIYAQGIVSVDRTLGTRLVPFFGGALPLFRCFRGQ